MFECNTIKSQEAGAWIHIDLVAQTYLNVRVITYQVVVDIDVLNLN